MANEWLMPFAMMVASPRETSRRASEPLVMTMLPGPPAQRAAVAAVAVTQQAESSIRRERVVARTVADAVQEAAATPGGLTRAQLDSSAVLRPIASDALLQRVNDAAFGAQAQLVTETVLLANQLIATQPGKHITSDEFEKKFPRLHHLLPPDQLGGFVQ
jgi:hypothetical protein